MIRKLLSILLLCGLLVATGTLLRADEPVDAILLNTDRLYADRPNLETQLRAVRILKEVAETNGPNIASAHWRLARIYIGLGLLSENADQKKNYFELAEHHGLEAVNARPRLWQAQLWYGMAISRAAQNRGILSSLFAVSKVKEIMQTVLILNPDNVSARVLLSELYRQAPPWPISIGSKDKAVHYGLEAVDREASISALKSLAFAYHEKGEKEIAKKYLDQAFTTAIRPLWSIEDEENLEKCKQLLVTLL